MSEYNDIEREILNGLAADEEPDNFDITEYGFQHKGSRKYDVQTKSFIYGDPETSLLDLLKESAEPFTSGRVFQSFDNTSSRVLTDTAKTVPRAVMDILQNVTEMTGAGLVTAGLLDDKDFQEFNQEFQALETKLKEGALEYDNPTYGTLVETVGRYLVPGVGIYKLFDNVIKIPGLKGILAKGLATDAALVGIATPSDEGNFVTFLKDSFGVEEDKGQNVVKSIVDYIGTVDKDPSATGVLEQKLKNILGDAPVAIVAEMIMPVVKLAGKLKSNQSTTSNISSESPLVGKSNEGTTGLNTDSKADGPVSSVGTKEDAASSQTTDTLSDDTDKILSSSSKNKGTANLNFSIPNKVYQKEGDLETLLNIHRTTFDDNQKEIAKVLNLNIVTEATQTNGKNAEIFGRVKTNESLTNKLRAKDKKPENLSDIQGHRILVQGSYKSAINKIKKTIIPKLRLNFKVLDVEYKQHIGTYHVQIVNPNNRNTSLELQVRPGVINKLIDKSHLPYAEKKQFTKKEWDSDSIRKLKNQAKSLIVSIEVDLKTNRNIPKKGFIKAGAVAAGLAATTKPTGADADETASEEKNTND
jgi:hypothetical protein